MKNGTHSSVRASKVNSIKSIKRGYSQQGKIVMKKSANAKRRRYLKTNTGGL